jgi:hypothetical protein
MFENLSNIISQNNALYKQIQQIKHEHDNSLKSFRKSIRKIEKGGEVSNQPNSPNPKDLF